MVKIKVERSTAFDTYEAILKYVASNKVCYSKVYNQKKKDQYDLFLNEDTTFDNVSISLYCTGKPVPVSGYEDEKIQEFKYLVLKGQEEDVLDLIKKAKEFYKIIEPENEVKIPVKIYNGEWYTKYYIKKRTNIYLPSGTFENIAHDLQLFYDSESDYMNLDIPWSRTYMLHGIPGTGKTSLIYTLASQFNKSISILDVSGEKMNDKILRDALYEVEDNSIVCMEDIDAMFTEDRENKNHNTMTFSGFLNVIDGIVQNKGLVIFMTTNFLNKISDQALKRRIDYYIKFDYMKDEQILCMFKKFYPSQDSKEFLSEITKQKLRLTPCILQKFFVRHLRDNVIDHIKELYEIVEDYKAVQGPNMWT